MAEMWDKLQQTWPARAAVGLWEGLTLPGDVYQGNVSMYGPEGQTNPQVINRAADLAGGVTLGAGMVPAEANALRAGGGRLRSETMDQFRGAPAPTQTIEEVMAARQAAFDAAMAARRGSKEQVAEIDMRAPRARKKAEPVPTGTERLDSETMRLFRERKDEL